MPVSHLDTELSLNFFSLIGQAYPYYSAVSIISNPFTISSFSRRSIMSVMVELLTRAFFPNSPMGYS